MVIMSPDSMIKGSSLTCAKCTCSYGFFKDILLLFKRMRGPVCAVYVEHYLGSQKRTSDPPELELQAVVGCPTWVLRSKPRSSGRAAGALTHRTISLVFTFYSFKALDDFRFNTPHLVVDQRHSIQVPFPSLASGRT